METLDQANIETVQNEDTVREAVKALQGEQGLKNSELAKQVGVSGTAISLWLSGKYETKGDDLTVKMSKWVESARSRIRSKSTLPEAPTWIETPTSRKVMNVLSYSQMAGDIAIVYGAAGLGKTKAIERYSLLNPSVWRATMSPATAGIFPCMEEIAEAAGLRNVPARLARITRALIDRFSGSCGLLVIDEAQHLSVQALEGIRSLHDASGVGVALVGNEAIYARIIGGNRAANFAQLFSRIGKRLRLAKSAPSDVTALADSFGVSGKPEMELLSAIAAKPGALRGVVKTMRLASMLAMGTGKKIEVDHIRVAWNDISGDMDS